MKNKILDVLKTKYSITKDLENRVEQLLECATDDNQFNNLDEILEWFFSKKIKYKSAVNTIDLKDVSDSWYFDKDTGNLKHKSGGFFEVIGVNTNTEERESGKGWSQPMVDQGTEASVIGLIKKKFNGVPHYLIDAKFEPGNYGKVQFSPTLQCTYDNLNKLHKGNKPKYFEYFEDGTKKDVMFEHWYPEDGGRFYLKRVKNMIVETEDDIEVSESHIWITMYQLKQLLKKDNIVNAHLRSVISYL
jgi:oxidase EvaA